MTEFFHWLSVNPMATVFFGLVAVIFVVLCVAGFLQGREIAFWPPRVSQKPEAFRRMVQIGDVHLPRDKPEELYDGTYKGRRGVHVPVVFEFPFRKYVKVTVSLQLIDVGDGLTPNINRVFVGSANINLKGFDVYFETWEDSKLWNAAASWIAVGE